MVKIAFSEFVGCVVLMMTTKFAPFPNAGWKVGKAIVLHDGYIYTHILCACVVCMCVRVF